MSKTQDRTSATLINENVYSVIGLVSVSGDFYGASSGSICRRGKLIRLFQMHCRYDT